ncbi:hypothetical protein KKA03_03265 [archaeon]|nr:hypothetical protein [archaeon]
MKLKENIGMRFWMLASLIVAMSFPLAYADCPDTTPGKYPGWEERFSGELTLGGNASAENFDVILEKVFGTDAIRVNILRDNGQYVTDSLTAGEEWALKKSDIQVLLHNASGTKANISIYTPQKANITANVTNIELLKIESDIIKLLPGEEFAIDFSINNTGEIEAKDIHVNPQFGDFEILDTDAGDMQSICPGSTREFKYTLKTPDLRGEFNYTLYLRFDYSDQNIETGEANNRLTYYPFNIEISPAQLRVSRSSSNWTLTNPGRDVSIKVTMNNSGSEGAYNVEWSADLPPYVQVSAGTTSFKGNIMGGKTKTFNYVMVSDDPIICSGISSATYEDRYGNDYKSVSDNKTFRFSPFITIDKSINKYVEYFDPIKSIFQGTTIREVDENNWWNKGETNTTTSSTEITLNRTRTLNITVKIKNMGNAVARGLLVKDTVKGATLAGTTSWNGTLSPGEAASYNYTIVSLNQRNISIDTNATYLDVDPASFKPSIEGIEGRPQSRYCTVTSKSIEFGNNEKLFALVPELVFNMSGLRVLAGSEFDFNFNLSNNGSDSVHDVLVHIDTTELRSGARYGGEILEGQSLYYLPELKAKHYPDGTLRSWSPINATYALVLRAPEVETQESFDITVTVNYTDFYGEVHSKNKTVNITVLTSRPAYEVATLEKKNLTVTSSSPGELDLDEYGDASIKLKNTGFADLENITITLDVPQGLELYSNDTAWHGRVVAELKRNDTWYGFEGEVAWNGSLSSGEEQTLLFLVRGKKSGLFDINAALKFNAHNLTGKIPIKVKGAILDITKSISDPLITIDESTVVKVSVTNIGESSARFVKIIDHVPANFDIVGEVELEVEELKPGEKTTLEYTLIPQKVGSYTIKKAQLEWTDELGNEYTKTSSALAIAVVEAVPTPTEEPPVDETQKLTRKQIAATAIFTVVFLLIMFKFLTLTRPIKEE